MAIRVLQYADEVALNHVAEELGVPADSLNKLIDAESRWDPKATGPEPVNARGLIQFTDTTARSLGYGSADDLVEREPTRADQLHGPVLKYLQRYAPYDSDQELYLAVFYPDARDWALDREFPEHVQEANKHIPIVTVRDYIRHVEGKGKGTFAAILIAAAIAGISIYVFFS